MPRILLAKDDNVVRDMRQAVLERDGFEGVAVANVTRSAQPYRNPSNAGRDPLIAHATEYDLSERVESREAALPPHADL
jgi:CheY-like chemotaxis protein